jgi:hypothetical protein
VTISLKNKNVMFWFFFERERERERKDSIVFHFDVSYGLIIDSLGSLISKFSGFNSERLMFCLKRDVQM